MLKLSIELSLSPLVEAHMHCVKFLSKACVDQCLRLLSIKPGARWPVAGAWLVS